MKLIDIDPWSVAFVVFLAAIVYGVLRFAPYFKNLLVWNSKEGQGKGDPQDLIYVSDVINQLRVRAHERRLNAGVSLLAVLSVIAVTTFVFATTDPDLELDIKHQSGP